MAGWLFGLGPVSAADVAAGKATAESCAGCHGPDGISQTADTPSLAGQPDDYIQWQLVYFRRGARKNELMELIAQSLTNEEIRNLGAYYASLLPPKPEPAAASDALAQTGAKLAAQRRCASCHGDDYVRRWTCCASIRTARRRSAQGACTISNLEAASDQASLPWRR